jgi:hypothetical protein
MRSSSIKVRSSTFGDFTLPGHFSQLFEPLTAPAKLGQFVSDSPSSAQHYTKPAVKANPPAFRPA